MDLSKGCTIYILDSYLVQFGNAYKAKNSCCGGGG